MYMLEKYAELVQRKIKKNNPYYDTYYDPYYNSYYNYIYNYYKFIIIIII